jgi:gliding motility-associated-like protein
VSATAGAFFKDGDSLIVTGIDTSIDVVIISFDSTNNCSDTLEITAPRCGCPGIPPPSGGGPISYCAGDTIPSLNATAEAGLLIDWYDAAIGGNLLQQSSPSFDPPGPGNYYAESRDPSTDCVSERIVFEVLQSSRPGLNLLDTICDPTGDFYSVLLETDLNNTFESNIGDQVPIPGVGLQFNNIPIDSVLRVRAINENTGCFSDITVSPPDCGCPPIDPPVSNGDQDICEGEPIPALSVNTPPGIIVDWYDAASSGNLIASNTNSLNPTVEGTFYAEAIDPTSGCTSATRTAVTLVVIPLPEIDAGPEQEVCGFSATLSGASDVVEVLWESDNANVTILNPDQEVTEISADQTGTYVFTFTALSGSCVSIDTTQITFQDIDIDYAIVPPPCPGIDGQLIVETLTDPGPWNLDFGSTGSVNLDSLPVTIDLATGSYDLVYSNDAGCVGQEMINVPEPEEPFVELGPDRTIEFGESVSINILTNLMPVNFSWSPTQGIFNDSSLFTTIQPDVTTPYTLTITDDNGCNATDSLLIIVIEEERVYIPNAFSPNGDGVNDVFTLYSDQDIIVRNIQVYNRWGDRVYERENLKISTLDGWDGTFNGKDAQEGVYAYYFELEFTGGRVEIFKGDVTLVR